MSGLDDLKKIKHKGTNIEVFDGFTVYSGFENIYLGSNIKLTDAFINAGTGLGKVTIDDYVFFGHKVMLLARGHDYTKLNLERLQTITEQPILIKQGAWICSNSVILGGVVIGEHAVVAAGSVVTKDVQPYTIVAGNPARHIKTINPDYASSSQEIKSKETLINEYQIGGNKIAQSSWGINTQAQRMEAIDKYATHGDLILDLGSGRGAYIKALTKRGFRAIGFDVNYYPEWRISGNNNFVIGTGTKLPFCDKSFDTTIAFEVLEHINNPVQALNEVARCTKERFIFSVPNCDTNNTLRQYDLAMAHWTDPTHCNFFTKESLRDFLSDNGFGITEMSDCYQISPNDYYWDSLKIPRQLSKLPKLVIKKLNLAETYWSSILVVAEVPPT